MNTLIANPLVSQWVIEERRASGADRYDEVWEGVYVVMPDPNDEHQDIVTGLAMVVRLVTQFVGMGQARAGVNISDRLDRWKTNYRVPDFAYFSNETAAENRGSHWHGGPDFAVEIISPNDRTREKFDFYAKVNTRELLLIDRDPWALELYRLNDGQLQRVGKSTLEAPESLTSEVVPLTFRLQPGDERPQITVAHNDGEQTWVI